MILEVVLPYGCRTIWAEGTMNWNVSARQSLLVLWRLLVWWNTHECVKTQGITCIWQLSFRQLQFEPRTIRVQAGNCFDTWGVSRAYFCRIFARSMLISLRPASKSMGATAEPAMVTRAWRRLLLRHSPSTGLSSSWVILVSDPWLLVDTPAS
jgi:hypothetical protein